MEGIHEQLTELSDDWYLLHLLAAHERGMEPRARERQVRLLDHLMQRESRRRPGGPGMTAAPLRGPDRVAAWCRSSRTIRFRSECGAS
jgi:hypothetical protein